MKKELSHAEALIGRMTAMFDDGQSRHLQRFFKTGPGQYGEGDRFLGIRVPQVRAIAKTVCRDFSPDQISVLLDSTWHEIRLAGLLILVEQMKLSMPGRADSADKRRRRSEIARFYLAHTRGINNWDLVDLSAGYILGAYLRLEEPFDYSVLVRLAASADLWEQRIAIVATSDFIRNGIYDATTEIADMLLGHPHDLIHKAVGWMLREVGKRSEPTLTAYLERNFDRMPRTALRYAIERMSEPERKAWLGGKPR